MKADLYVQGNFWATIDVPGDGLLALLARGMIAEAQQKAEQLQRDLNDLDGVVCSISLRLQGPTTYPPGADRQRRQGEITWPDKEKPSASSTTPTKP